MKKEFGDYVLQAMVVVASVFVCCVFFVGFGFLIYCGHTDRRQLMAACAEGWADATTINACHKKEYPVRELEKTK